MFSPAFILNDILLCFVRNDDSPRLAMTAMIIGSFSNISYFYGKGIDRQVRAMLRYSLQAMLVISLFIYVILFVFAQPIASVFNSENNPELQRIAVMGLKIYFTSSAFVGYNTILAIFFTSVEKVLPAHILSILRGFILIIPMALLLSAIGGMTGIWLTYPMTEALVAVLGYVIYKYYQNKVK